MILNAQKRAFFLGLVSLITVVVGVVFFVGVGRVDNEDASAAQNLWMQYGYNDYGTMCNNLISVETTPRPYPSLSTTANVAGGEGFSLVARADGTVLAAGQNDHGQLGIGTFTAQEDSTLIPSLSGIDKVYAGNNFAFALDTANGSVWGWGENTHGQLGINNNLDQATPVQVFASNVIDIAPGEDHTLFLRSDNTVLAAGNNFYGQLGDSTNTAKNFPVSTGLSNIVEVSGGDGFSVALDASGGVFSWGFGGLGQLGQGNFTDTNSPILIASLTNVEHIRAGREHVLVSRTDDTLWEWGRVEGLSRNSNPENPAQVVGLPGGSTYTGITRERLGVGRANGLVVDDAGDVVIWGSNLHGQSGNSSWSESIAPTVITFTPGIIELAAVKGDFVQVSRSDGTLSGWGFNHFHNIGYANTATGSSDFLAANSQNYTSVGGGKTHTLIVKNDGSLLSCGLGFAGQLGLGTNANSLNPTAVPGLANITQAVGSNYGSFALSSGGTVYEWGDTPAGSNSPVLISGLNNIVSIVAGQQNLYAIDAVGDLYVYGNNPHTAGLNGGVPIIPQVTANGVRSVACAEYSCAYVDDLGSVYSTGNNYSGQLGGGTTGNTLQNTFVQVTGIVGAENIFSHHNFEGYSVITSADEVYVWGSEEALGSSQLNPMPTPALLAIEDVESIGFMFDRAFALKTDGSLWSWNRSNPSQYYYIEKVSELPLALGGTTAYVKGDLLEPITNIFGLNVFCQTSVTDSSTTCRFDIPPGERLPESFALQIGNGVVNSGCVEAGNIAFCENVSTGSVPGIQDIFVVIDGSAAVDSGEDVQIDALDSDGDGMPDSWENTYSLDPNDPSDVSGDPDGDLLNNINEYINLTDPQQGDTDFDFVSDGVEVNILLTDPLVTDSDSGLTVINEAGNNISDGAEDFDGDGFTNSDEINNGSNPFDSNSRPATVLSATDIPELVFNCSSASSNSSTSCVFNLPVDKLLPANFLLKTGGDSAFGGSCALNNTTRVVTCLNVSVGSLVGSQDILAQINVGGAIDTGEDLDVGLQDSDGDGLPDVWEIQYGLNPNSAIGNSGPLGDPDGDNLTHLEEYFYGTNPNTLDSDGDGLGDGLEVGDFKTDPLNADSDSARTIANEANNSVSDNNEDFDGDGFNNGEEIQGNSNPFDQVSTPSTEISSIDIPQMVWFCGEGLVNSQITCRSTIPAGKKVTSTLSVTIGSASNSPVCAINGSSIECNAVPSGNVSSLQTIFVQIGSNPKINTGERVRINGSVQSDGDNDGLPDSWESQFGLNPNSGVGNDGAGGDADGDGLTNIQEYNNGTNPGLADTDGDGVSDGDEILILSTDPSNGDSNSLRTTENNAGNGVNDGAEDFDGDGFNNRDEIAAGTDPFNVNATPGSTFDSLDIQELTVYCQEGLINSSTDCTFTLPQNKFLPSGFKLGVSNAIPGGTCVTSGVTVNCTNVPTGSFEGLQFVYGQINSQQSVNTGERVRISAILATDSDGDGLPDSWEISFDLDERNAEGFDGSEGDPDDDGFTNIQEFNFGTNPLRADTDGDGVNDKDESEILLTDPTNGDSDSSRTENVDERDNGINDGDEDFDGDGYTNRQEIFSETSSFNASENPLTGPTGDPVAQNPDNVDDESVGGVEDVVPNLNNTNRTGGLQILSLLGSSFVAVGVIGLLVSSRRKMIVFKDNK